MDTDTTRSGAGAPASTSEVLSGLNDLLQLDHDAVGAYDIAIEKLQDRDHADQIAGFRRDHERHIRELSELITELGGTPKNEPHATAPLKQALQNLGGLAGDKGVLMAFRTNELQVRSKYDSYAAKANTWPDAVKRIVDRNALDEERHYRWVADTLAHMGVGMGEGPEIDAVDRARERSMQAGAKLDSAKQQVTDTVHQVRDRVQSGTQAVTNRISGLFGGGEGGGPMQTVKDKVGSATHQAQSAQHQLEERYRKNTLPSLLAAGVAGFVIGRLLR